MVRVVDKKQTRDQNASQPRAKFLAESVKYDSAGHPPVTLAASVGAACRVVAMGAVVAIGTTTLSRTTEWS